jgi:hypothetical protein
MIFLKVTKGFICQTAFLSNFLVNQFEPWEGLLYQRLMNPDLGIFLCCWLNPVMLRHQIWSNCYVGCWDREERVDRETAAAALQYPRRYSTAGTVHRLGLEGSG